MNIFRRDDPWPLAGLLLIAAAYFITIPGFPGPSGDNAEFQCLARTLGTSHPTGYPLYLMLSHVFQAIVPVGSLAWKVNLLSWVCGIGALMVFWRTGLRLGLRPWSIALTMGWLASTSTCWRLSTVAEVYSLHVLITLACFFCLLKWHDHHNERFLRLAIFLHALSYANHLTTLLVLPALLYFVLATNRRALTSPAVWRWCVAAVIGGASMYLYVVIQSRLAAPELVYAPIDSPRAFIAYVTGSDFHGSFSAQGHMEAVVAHVHYIPFLIWEEWGWTLPLITAGLVAGWRSRSPAWRMLAVMFAAQIFMVFLYRIPDIQDYLLLPAAGGALFAARFLEAAKSWAARGRMQTAVAALAALFVFGQTARAAHDVALRIRYRGGLEDADILVQQTTPPGENVLLLLPHWKQYSIARYYTVGEGRGDGKVRVELWQTDEIRERTPEELAARLEAAAREYRHIRLYGREGNPGYDLPRVLSEKGVPVREVSRYIWEIPPFETYTAPGQ